MANLPDGDLATLDQFVMAVLQSVANGEITGLEARDDIMQPLTAWAHGNDQEFIPWIMSWLAEKRAFEARR